MKKTTFIIAIFCLLISFISCNQTKENATETTNKTIEQEIEKLDAAQFRIKMQQLEVYNLVDVRTPKEFEQASILKAKNIDFNGENFETELAKLDKEKPLFIYCKSGGRSAKAAEKAKEMGFEHVIELDGGYQTWEAPHRETQHGI